MGALAMASTKKDPLLVVIQLTGGNDYMNTVIPYGDPLYYDNRPTVGIPQDQVLPIDDHVGFHPALAPIKELYAQGKVAIINGVGYPNPNRSHFRAMDIWHTCEPERMATEGWLGRVIRDLDPTGENVLTGGKLRTWLASGPGFVRYPRSVGWRIGRLWSVDQHRRPATAHRCPGHFCPNVRPGHRHGSDHGLPGGRPAWTP